MGFLELKAYSGTTLENFRDCAFVKNGRIFFEKSDRRFQYHDVYYTPRLRTAVHYAVNTAHYFDQTPLVIVAKLGIHKFFPPHLGPLDPSYSISILPVNSALVLNLKVDREHYEDGVGWENLAPLFEPIDIQQILDFSCNKY